MKARILSVCLLALLVLPAVPAAAADVRTPVQGQSRLTEQQVLQWFTSIQRPAYRASVPPAQLISHYRAEGERLGIAWDIAFMQAILETSWFNFPDTGQVRPTDNNFAGMGAFDNSSGAFVFRFPDATTGVRAQLQHLRLYADPTTNLQGTNLGVALAQDLENRYPDRWRAVRRQTLSDGTYQYAGRVPDWTGFGSGMWATDPYYPCKVLNLYRRSLEFNGQRTDGLPTNPTCLRTWHLRYENRGGVADAHGYLGRDGDDVLACDWNGNGRDTPATFRDGRWTISNSPTGATPHTTFTFGRAGDIPVCGDWNGDRKAGVGVVRDGVWLLRDSLSGGSADRTFTYGRVARGDVPIVGNWNGQPGDGVGIIRDGEWHLRMTPSAGPGQLVFRYGRILQGDRALVGDWNGTGVDGVGIVRGGEWHLRNRLSGGAAELVFIYGRVRSGDVPLTGDWNGDARSTPAIVR